MELTKRQKERYARHITLDEIGEEGQKKLLGGSTLIIGTGGLGSPAALYLAAAGVGTIGIADNDAVDLSNLQRQIIHSEKDIGTDKTLSAKEKMNAVNSDVTVNTYQMRVTEDNIADLIKSYDIVIDACDNFETKFLINDACVAANKPFVHAGILRFRGQLMTYVPERGPCYRCIFRDMPPKEEIPTAREMGIIGSVAGVIGSLEAMEAVKYITGAGELLTGKLLTCDLLKMEFRKIELSAAGDCPSCGK